MLVWNFAAPAVTGGGVVVVVGTATVGSVTVGVVGAAVVGVVGMGAGVSVGTTMEVGSTRLPVSVGTAYGGSNRPNRPHALQGQAHDLTSFGAASTGLQRESSVAIPVGSTVWGQSVRRSLRVSCRVIFVPSTMVDT